LDFFTRHTLTLNPRSATALESFFPRGGAGFGWGTGKCSVSTGCSDNEIEIKDFKRFSDGVWPFRDGIGWPGQREMWYRTTDAHPYTGISLSQPGKIVFFAQTAISAMRTPELTPDAISVMVKKNVDAGANCDP